MIRAPEKQKGATMEEKREKMIDNLIMKNILGPQQDKMQAYKHVEGVKVPINKFLPPPKIIMYCPLNDTHMNEIKHQILMFHYINQQLLIFTIFMNPNDPTKIQETRPKNWSTLSDSMFFLLWVDSILSSA
jgi:hypothetical protein